MAAKVMIAVPNSFGMFQQEWVMSVFGMQAAFYEWQFRQKREDSLSIISMGGVQLDEMRNDLVKQAIEAGQTHVLFLDADMAFPRGMVQMMLEDLEDNPEIEAVTGIYTWKRPPYLPHVYHEFDKKSRTFSVAASFPLDSLFKVEGAGTGCLMVKTSVFERTPYPWFRFGAAGIPEFDGVETKPGIDGLGEDLYFCLKAKPMMVCDPRLRCVHYKTVGYGLSDYVKTNGLTADEKKGINPTKSQVEKISLMHNKGMGSFLQNDLVL